MGLRRARGGYKKKKKIRQVHTFPKDCTFITVISENYNQQSCSLHQPFSTSQKITIIKHLVKAKTTRKRKRKRRRRRKEGRRGIVEGTGLKAFKARRPLQALPLTQIHQMAGLGNNVTPTTSGTREQCNSYKGQNDETKRRPTTTKQTPRSGDQTLKLHHVRTPTLSKRGRRLGEE